MEFLQTKWSASRTNASSYMRRGLASALPLFLLAACTTRAPDSGELPCGPDVPETCVAIEDGVCFFPEIPPPYAPDAALTDEWIDELLSYEDECGVTVGRRCAEGRYVARSGMSIDLSHNQRIRFYEAGDRELVALALKVDFESCDFYFFGDPGAASCIDEVDALVRERMPTCTGGPAEDHCDPCSCHYNDITDAVPPDCGDEE